MPKLVSGLTRGLFRDDIESHWASLLAYDVPQAVIPENFRNKAHKAHKAHAADKI